VRRWRHASQSLYFIFLCCAGGTLAKVFMTPITVISAAVDTLKFMFPLMMITVPICYVRNFAAPFLVH
jgi:hypothetical protein